MDSLATAEIVLYALLLGPVVFTFVRHMPEGMMAWGYLGVFCVLRVIDNAITLGDHHSTTGNILVSVGLSPLLFSVCGVLHESRIYRFPGLDIKSESFRLTAFHVLVIAGIFILATGSSSLQTGGRPVLVDVGIAVIAAAWLALVIWAGATFLETRAADKAGIAPVPLRSESTTLLVAASIAIVLVCVRLVYSIVALTTREDDLNAVTGELGVRVGLSFLPELLTVVLLIAAGIKTRHVALRMRQMTHLDDS